MTDDMVKKSVDITKEDEDWLEDSYINFSKFVRRKIAERRAESIKDHTKERLHNQIIGMANRGQELKNEWKDEVSDLKDEFDAEVIEKDYTHWIFEFNGEEYSAHWRPDDPFEGIAQDIVDDMPEEAKEFANKFVDAWFDKLDRWGEYVEEETDFKIVGGDEATQDLEGTGYLSDFSLYTKYLPTDAELFTIKFESRVDLEIQDIENSLDFEF